MAIINYFKTKLAIYLYFAIGFVLNILSWLWVMYYMHPSGDILPLHYNIYFGIDHIGSGWFLYWQPAVGLLIILMNLVLVKINKSKQGLILYLSLLTVLCQLAIGLSLFLLFINHF
jgi:hypothetical protein